MHTNIELTDRRFLLSVCKSSATTSNKSAIEEGLINSSVKSCTGGGPDEIPAMAQNSP